MLWDVQALMKPALSVIDMIPDVHRSHALTALERAVKGAPPLRLSLSDDEQDLALFGGRTKMTSPVGAAILLRLYHGGHIKLKKPARKTLPTLQAYAAGEAAFREKVRAIEAAQVAADPDQPPSGGWQP